MVHLVTGAAGFIGFHVAAALLREGHQVVGLDSLNDYYSPKLKADRASLLGQMSGYTFVHGDICDTDLLKRLQQEYRFSTIFHFAAQAGVRHSIDRPRQYVQANLDGFASVLEMARLNPEAPLIFASSSSVYGANAKIPFSADDPVARPISFYGATKVANEAMAYSYHHLFGIPMAGLRFFTVYGPWGRPDMAYYKFACAIRDGRAIDVYSGGEMQRSFTYIDDVVAGVLACRRLPPGFEILNIGNDATVPLRHFIHCLESSLGKKAVLNFLPAQPGDMQATAADIALTTERIGFKPTVSIEEGIERFVHWFNEYSEPCR